MLSGLKHWIGRTFFDFSYGILYRKREEKLLCEIPSGGNGSFRILKPTLRYWYADPIALHYEGRDWVFCEIYDRRKKKGLIGVCAYEKGRLKRPKVILEEDFHLSFPNVFQWEGGLYMVPETSEARQIRIYQLKEGFQPELKFAVDTEEGLVDTAVAVENGRFYLLASALSEKDPKKCALRLYRIDNFEKGTMTEIPLDRKYREYSYWLRNGGPILESAEGRVRILQESTQTEYGHNLIIRHILSLGDEGLKEEKGRVISLEDYACFIPFYYRKQGTHTYGFSEGLEVADVSFNRFHLGNIFL